VSTVRPFPAALERAVSEGGRIVCLVFCRPCGDARGPLAKVLDTAEGLLFKASWTTKAMRDEMREHEVAMRAKVGRRVPFLVGEGVYLLLDRPERGQDWPPRVRCPTHGMATLSVDELRQAVRRARPRKAVVTVHD
jgi:hypothetical protein